MIFRLGFSGSLYMGKRLPESLIGLAGGFRLGGYGFGGDGLVQGGELAGEDVEDEAVGRQEEECADHEFEQVIDKGDVRPVGGHKGIAAAGEGDGEEKHGIHGVAGEGGGGGGDPPGFQLAQAVEHDNIENLADNIGGKAGQGDAEHGHHEHGKRAPACPRAFLKQHGKGIRNEQGGEHDEEDNAPGEALAEDAHG